jgi:hypothetical protein
MNVSAELIERAIDKLRRGDTPTASLRSSSANAALLTKMA